MVKVISAVCALDGFVRFPMSKVQADVAEIAWKFTTSILALFEMLADAAG